MINEEIIKRIENGPAVLLLGQRYLKLNSNKDILLEKIITKFQGPISISSENNYDVLTKLNLSTNYETFSAWTENLCKDISVPKWLERIANVPWSHIYTSSIDTIISNAFISEWRK